MAVLNKLLGENASRALGLTNKEEFERIKVEDKILSISDSRVLVIDNITRVTSQVVVVPWLVRVIIFVMMVNAFLFGFLPFIGDVSWAFGILMLVLLVWMFRHKAYGVRIDVAGGMAELLSTPDMKLADQLFKALIPALKDGGRTQSIVVTNENGNVTIVKGDHVMGDLFKDVRETSIVNKSEVLGFDRV